MNREEEEDIFGVYRQLAAEVLHMLVKLYRTLLPVVSFEVSLSPFVLCL